MSDTTTPAQARNAGRAPNGDIRMSEGRGSLVAIQSDSRYQIEERLIESRPGRFRDQAMAALALLDREAEAARVAAGIPRPSTPDRKTLHGNIITRKRTCNACGRTLGDMTKPEIAAWYAKEALPDVHDECGCVRIDELNAKAEVAYLAAHPEFVPSDLKRGERVTMASAGPGTIVDVRENGASLTVRWDDSPIAILQNVASGHLTRLAQNAGR